MNKNIGYARKEKLAIKVQNAVSQILRQEYMDDPIISGVSLAGVDSSGGLSFVRLFYHSRSEDIQQVQKRLDEITRSVRFELAKRLNQKFVPEIKFTYDNTLEKASRIDELLEQIKI